MIIVEGPDGSGKSTLVNELCKRYPNLALHDRASHGVAGPVSNLYSWAEHDVLTWSDQLLSIYDRHPLVSEYVYGPVIRGGLDFRFHTTNLRRLFSDRALIVLCLPPLDVVRSSVSDERDMSGVTTHIDTIWSLYSTLRATWPHSSKLFHWDYTSLFSEQYFYQLCGKVDDHIRSWAHSYD